MANLVVSNVCSASCGYCFANAYLASTRTAAAPAFMSLEEFDCALDFLDRSGIDEARILGGEPTLHPDFPALVRQARRHGKRVVVFTHGGMPEAALQSLLDVPAEECSVIVNVSAVFAGSSEHRRIDEQRRRGLHELGPRAQLGFTIQSPDFDLTEVIRTAAETAVRKVIRLGMALPGPQASNRSVHPKQYRSIGSRIARQAGLAARQGVGLDLDCGFVRCMFSDEEIASLKQNGSQFGWHCSPVLDICPGGEVLHCFSLSDRFKQPFSSQATSASLHAAFDVQTRPYRTAGVFRECSTCAFKIGQECSGGCLSATLRRFQPAAIRVELPENDLYG
jgi:organic radical activating enzyme